MQHDTRLDEPIGDYAEDDGVEKNTKMVSEVGHSLLIKGYQQNWNSGAAFDLHDS